MIAKFMHTVHSVNVNGFINQLITRAPHLVCVYLLYLYYMQWMHRMILRHYIYYVSINVHDIYANTCIYIYISMYVNIHIIYIYNKYSVYIYIFIYLLMYTFSSLCICLHLSFMGNYPQRINIHPASRGVAAHTAGLFRSVRGAKGGFPPWGSPS